MVSGRFCAVARTLLAVAVRNATGAHALLNISATPILIALGAPTLYSVAEIFLAGKQRKNCLDLNRISTKMIVNSRVFGEHDLKPMCMAYAMVKLMSVMAIVAVLGLPTYAVAAEKALSFHVLNQRTIVLTAEYWNLILFYVSANSGVPLLLKLAKTAHEGNALAETGVYDFIYTNHFFAPARDRLGYNVVARPAGPGVQSQIVVPAYSTERTLEDVNGKDIAPVAPFGVTGYWLPLDALLKAKVKVNVILTANQEASFAQLKINKVAAAGVNSNVMARNARREAFEYRVLWTSEDYQHLCIMASPRIAADKASAVRNALVGMSKDSDGRKILNDGADLLKITEELGFVAAENRDYDDYRTFYQQLQVN